MHQIPLPLRKPPGEVDRLSRAPSFCSHRPILLVPMCEVVMVHGLDLQSLHHQDPTYQGAKLPQKLFLCQYLLWSAFRNNAYNPCKKCHQDLGHVSSLLVTIHSHVEERSQRLGGSRIILLAPLGFISWKPLVCGRSTGKQLSKEASGSSAGIVRAVCIRWPLHYASWAEILARGQPVCLLVFPDISSQALLC